MFKQSKVLGGLAKYLGTVESEMEKGFRKVISEIDAKIVIKKTAQKVEATKTVKPVQINLSPSPKKYETSPDKNVRTLNGH